MDRDGSALIIARARTAARSAGPAVVRAATVVPIAFLAVFFVWPVVRIVGTGLAPEGTPALGAFVEVLTDPITARVAWFTLWQAVASTVLTVVIALPGAYAFSRLKFRGAGIVSAGVMIPFVLPTVVVASAFLALLGPRSPINDMLALVPGMPDVSVDLRRTVTAILIAHVFFNYAVIVRTVGGLWAHLDPRMEAAARLLGASRWRAFSDVTLPLLRPAIAASAAIVFLFTFTSFGVVLLLGGPQRATIEVEIHRATTQLLDLPMAAALAMLQLTAVVAALAIYGRLARRRTTQSLVATAIGVRRPRTRAERAFLAANLAVIALLLAAPLLVLIERSFATETGWDTDHYRALFTPDASVLSIAPWQAIRNTIVFACGAALIALIVGGIAATAATRPDSRGAQLLDRALMVPLGTSAVTVGFGFLLAFRHPPLDVFEAVWLVPVAQALIATPFVVRTLLPVLRSIDPRLRDAAAVLGATPGQVWREVDLPIVSRAALVAAGFAFAVSAGEFGATVFIARSDWPTMPVAIFRLLGRPGITHFGQAMAMSTLLMAVTAAVIVAIDRVRVGQVGRF
ncbi:MAG: iron ABC transporter permease [Nitriliruptoraceae bacterium]